MLRLTQKLGMKFLATGEPSGGAGSVGNPNANQGGASETNDPASMADPFAGLDMDDLDPQVRAHLEKGKVQFATLQKRLADEAKAREQQENLARSFQGRYDQLQAQLGKVTNQTPVDPAEAARQQQLDKMTKILVSKNVPAESARAQAEIMVEMMGEFATTLKGEIGRDLAPFASSVVQREAEFAWQQVLQTDNTGALQIPEVANATFAQVQTMVERGQQVTPEVVKNLTGMMYFDHLQKGGAIATSASQQVNSPQLPNFGRTTFTGAGHAPTRVMPVDPNAPKHQLDSATNAALQSVMSKWEVKPKAYVTPTRR